MQRPSRLGTLWVWGVCERESKCVKCVCALSVCQFGMKDRLATSFGNKARKILTNHARQMSIQKLQVCTSLQNKSITQTFTIMQ